MSDTPPPPSSFATPQEEVMYWKKCLEDKQQELDDLEQNFNEYQEFSKQLEEEMETELRACEKKHADLVSQHARLKNDYESIQDKLNGVSRESSGLIASLQDEVDKLKHLKQTLMVDKRRLEQENDTLERRERASSASVQDLTEKLDRVMEENVWMQSELEESKQNADETIQRLREEMRELKQDLSAKDKKVLIKPIPTEKTKRENPMSFHIPRPHKSQRQRAEDTPSTGATSSISVVTELINLVSDLENKITYFRSRSINGGIGGSTTSNNSGITASSPPQSPMASPSLKSIMSTPFNTNPIPFPSLLSSTESSSNNKDNNHNNISVSSPTNNTIIFSSLNLSSPNNSNGIQNDDDDQDDDVSNQNVNNINNKNNNSNNNDNNSIPT